MSNNRKNGFTKLMLLIFISSMLSGCSVIKNDDHIISEANSTNSTKTIIIPTKPAGKVIAEATKTPNQIVDTEYSQGDIPRVYITTANYVNKINSMNNLALDKKVTVCSCEAGDLHEANLVDGNIASRWASEPEDDEYFLIDLGSAELFSHITIKWESAYGKKYSISVSKDNVNWTQIVDEKNGKPSDMEYNFDQVTARYIKWQGIERGTEYGYSIFEFGVYKDSASAKAAEKVKASDYPYLNSFTDQYQPISIAILGSLGNKEKTIIDKATSIKIRGNSTALVNKKPYNFKLSSKQNVLGLGKGKKWCLLANHFDKTMLRNKISYDFADALKLPTKLTSTFVDVYIDGIYEGNYLLSEPASDGNSRVDLDTKNGEYLFERCVYVKETDVGMFESPLYHINFEFKAPDADEVTKAQKTQLVNFLEKAEEAIKSGKQSILEKFIDLESFSAMYVFEELFKNVDYSFDSEYFYVKGGKLYAGPIWDMDLSMGNVSATYEYEPYYAYRNAVIGGKAYGNGSGDSTEGLWALSGWYKELMKYKFFTQLISEKFDQVETAYEKLYGEGGIIDSLVDQYGTAFKRNYSDTYWDITKPYSVYEREAPESSYEENVKYLKNWLKKRKEWVYKNRQ